MALTIQERLKDLRVERFRYIPLSTHKTDENAEKNTRWKVYINSIIETDEI
mgnify:CR=1 FL=1